MTVNIIPTKHHALQVFPGYLSSAETISLICHSCTQNYTITTKLQALASFSLFNFDPPPSNHHRFQTSRLPFLGSV